MSNKTVKKRTTSSGFIRPIRLFLLMLLVLAAIGGWAAYYVYQQLQPMPATGETVTVTIEPGTSMVSIGDRLQQNGIIRNGQFFVYMLKYKGEGSRFQAGTYELRPGMSIDEIAAILNNGRTVAIQTDTFTIPEGFTISQIADRLAGMNLINRANFIALAGNPASFTGTIASEVPVDSEMKFALEGYLFPETYELIKGSSDQQIIQTMLDQLSTKLTQLPADWQQKMSERKISFHQLLTIASLVEREVVVDAERPLVAGVIYNRLEQKMPLQIDATVQYLFDKQKERLFEKDLLIESPYNTYRNDGLPPGPIASPSLASIEAALYPEKSDYLFYVTKKDGTSEHLFAITYEQHLANIEQSKK